MPNIDELRLIFNHNCPFIIVITETWLNNTIADDEINISGYTVLRRDRQGRRGGGCALYIADGFRFKSRKDLEEQDFEAVWIEGKICNINYVIGCVYRAPDSSASHFFDYVDDVLRDETRSGKEVIITGDLNCNLHDESLAQTQRALEFMEAN